MIFVFIGGASGSGKTGLSRHILSKLLSTGISAQILNMDDYYHEIPQGVNIEEFRRNTNFDTPDMLHLDLFKQHIVALNQGNSITKPLFVFKTNRREGEEVIKPSEVIIIEGIFAQYFYKNFWPTELVSLTINVGTESYLDIVDRRIRRDIEQRGRIRTDSIKQERKYVGPGFLKYTASSSMNADIYINNAHKNGAEEQQSILDVAANEVIAQLNQMREKIASGKELQSKKLAPNVQEMVAKSHLIAGTLFNRRFDGFFSGVFGNFKGEFVKELSEQEVLELRNSIS